VLTVVFLLRYVLTSTWVYSWDAAPADVLAAPPRRRPAHAAPPTRRRIGLLMARK
jgi:hypothetical protein